MDFDDGVTSSDMSISQVDLNPLHVRNIVPRHGSPSEASTSDYQSLRPEDSISMRPMPGPGSVIDIAGEQNPATYNVFVNGALLTERHGRAFNVITDKYILPADDDEHSRHDVQHKIAKLFLGSNYMAPDLVHRALTPNGQWKPAILDIGTGSGRWAIEMAREFPEVDVVGIDLAPPRIPSTDEIPENCRFEVDDAALPLDHYRSTFNVVHIRCATGGFHDFNKALFNFAKVMRPGAILLMLNTDPQLVDPQGNWFPVTDPGEPGYTAFQRFFGMVYNSYLEKGACNGDHSMYFLDYLKRNPNLKDVQGGTFHIPLGDWEKNITDQRRYISELMRLDFTELMTGFRTRLIEDGYNAEEIDKLILEAVKEMQERRFHAYVPWTYAWAIRTDEPWKDMAPEQSLIPDHNDTSRWRVSPLRSKHGRFTETRTTPPPSACSSDSGCSAGVRSIRSDYSSMSGSSGSY